MSRGWIVLIAAAVGVSSMDPRVYTTVALASVLCVVLLGELADLTRPVQGALLTGAVLRVAVEVLT